MILENGLYRAVVRDISVHLRGENERLTAALRLECEGKELVHREWLELNDGTISDKTIRRLRECFPKWDGSIEMLEQGFCVQGVEVDITVENEADRDDPEKWWTRIRYMDPPGGASGTAAMPERESRATLVSKYGGRFRALAGGTSVGGGQRSEVGSQRTEVGGPRDAFGKRGLRQKSEDGGQTDAPGARREVGSREEAQGTQRDGHRAGPPTRPPAKSGAAAGKVEVTATLEDCWEAICKKHPDEMREQVSERWFATLEQTVPGKDQADFGPEDWGHVLAHIQ